MKLKNRRGVPLPAKMKCRSWIVVGPPGSGKSHLIDRIHGCPGEICIDISMKKWWTVEPLAHRPREIHLAVPFKGFKEGYSVYDEKWIGVKNFPEVDFDRIRIPYKKKFILAPNWRARFVFDFILPPPAWLHRTRINRLSSGDVRLVDMNLTPEWIAWQIHTLWRIAWFFHQAGLQVMLRPFSTARPYAFPVLAKIMKKMLPVFEKEITPAADWSRIHYVRRWMEEASPEHWKPVKKIDPRDTETPVTTRPYLPTHFSLPAFRAGLVGAGFLSNYQKQLSHNLKNVHRWFARDTTPPTA